MGQQCPKSQQFSDWTSSLSHLSYSSNKHYQLTLLAWFGIPFDCGCILWKCVKLLDWASILGPGGGNSFIQKATGNIHIWVQQSDELEYCSMLVVNIFSQGIDMYEIKVQVAYVTAQLQIQQTELCPVYIYRCQDWIVQHFSCKELEKPAAPSCPQTHSLETLSQALLKSQCQGPSGVCRMTLEFPSRSCRSYCMRKSNGME